jgi:hypothetical protein
MIRQMTVRQILEHSAMTRLPSNWNIHKILKLVDEVIDVLGLTHVQNTIIGDQEKRGIRLNIFIFILFN